MNPLTRTLLILGACASLCVVSVVIALSVGSVGLPIGETLAALTGNGSDLSRQLVLELRLPRTLNALAVGALLAVAGVYMQVLLRNPLADPYILGISSGAAVGALSGVAAGVTLLLRQSFALAGALLVMALVYRFARSDRGFAPLRLLLTGVVIAAGLNAVISLLLATSDDTSLRGMLFWMMGDLSLSTYYSQALIAAVASVAIGVLMGRALDVLALGSAQAFVVGLSVSATRRTVYVLASVMTAVAVTAAGSIGFVGLVVPHAVRLVIGPGHRLLIPASALIGGTLLIVADTAARTIVAPRQLPVGALIALIGVPFFLVLMRRASLPRT
ncbi:MAG: FecCD family ABC transporter permease [Gammaproteobacteria bacterium]